MRSPGSTNARRLLAVGAVTFVLLGLPEGVQGTVWPSMRASFDRPVSDLAWLVATYTAAYLLSTLASGHIERRVGAGRALAGSAATSLVGLALFATSPGWGALLAASFAVGIGGAGVDAGLNAYVALRHGTRAMNYLHGFFGIGATLGPLAVTASLGADVSWRWVYALLAGLQAVIALVLVRERRGFVRDPAIERHPARPRNEGGTGPAQWLALAFFFLYVGIEVTLGQWSFSLLTEERGLGDTPAGLAVAAYWGGLTGGRFALGSLGDRLDPRRLLAFAVPMVLGAVAIFWWDPGANLGAIGLPLAGLALAGIFPALMTLTPEWRGADGTSVAVGYQMAAASAGAISLPVLIGVLERRGGLEVVGPCLTVAAVAMVVVERAVATATPPRVPEPGTSVTT